MSFCKFSVFSVFLSVPLRDEKGLSTGEMPGFYNGDYRGRVRDVWRFGERRSWLVSVVFPVFAFFAVKRRWKDSFGII